MCNAIWRTKIEFHFGAGHATLSRPGRNESKTTWHPDLLAIKSRRAGLNAPDLTTAWGHQQQSSLVPVLAHTNSIATPARTHDLCPVSFRALFCSSSSRPTHTGAHSFCFGPTPNTTPIPIPLKLAISAPPNCRQEITFYFAAVFNCFPTWPKAKQKLSPPARL